jgi:hypothetical protein
MRGPRRTYLLVAGIAVAIACVTACSSTPDDGDRPTRTGPSRPATSTTPGPSSPSPTSSPPSGTDDWTTYHYSLDRQGFDPHIPKASGHLKVAWSTRLDGAVYAEPLVIGSTVVVVTENDTAYGVSLEGDVLWKSHLGTPVPVSKLPCGDIDPLGITGTPIYWPATDRVYFAAELDNPIRHRLYAIDPSNGRVDWSRGVDPAGSTPRVQQQRGSMAIAQGRVWVSFGALAGDCGPYHGWEVGSLLSGGGALSIYRTPSARGAGLWAPTGPSVDEDGHLYVAPANGAAFAPPYDDSDSIVKLDGATKIDLWAPDNWAQENADDRGQGPTAPILFEAFGKRLAFVTGKAGPIYLLDQDHLGGIGGQLAQAENCPAFGGSAFHDDVLFVPCTDGLSAYAVRPGPRLAFLWRSSDTGYGSAPVVGGGAVWALSDGRLVQLDPATGDRVARVAVGETAHFATPTLHGHLVLAGTMNGITAVSTR